jgi:lipopolysaccharide/colanic/teichoic acid biosynthesis glycosyltransferase
MTRLRDTIIASCILLAVSPVLLIIMLLIRLDSPGGAIYRQERVGLGGTIFRIHKLRTLQVGLSGPLITKTGDDRVTHVGRWLRTSKLDELPQLIDVIQGNMSLVGPRPEVPLYVDLWPAEARLIILSVRPGITDPITVRLRSEEQILAASPDPERTYIDELLPLKTDAYVRYVQSRTAIGDFGVVVATLLAVLFPKPVPTPAEEVASS